MRKHAYDAKRFQDFKLLVHLYIVIFKYTIVFYKKKVI